MKDLITLQVQPSAREAEDARLWIYNDVVGGNLDPIKVAASLKFYDKIINGDSGKSNGLIHMIKDEVVKELEKAPERKDYYGFEVTIKEAGARYDFSNCNHPKLQELYEKQAILKAKIDELEKMLKGIPQGKHIMMVDEDTGDMIKVYAPLKRSTTSPNFILK